MKIHGLVDDLYFLALMKPTFFKQNNNYNYVDTSSTQFDNWNQLELPFY